MINIKQAGGFLDERTFYVFNGFQDFEYNGMTYRVRSSAPQIGPVDDSQGDGTVGDLRGEVDADMDPVYQDELILGFQSMIDDKWSWGVRGIYRSCTTPSTTWRSLPLAALRWRAATGFVMANPGQTSPST